MQNILLTSLGATLICTACTASDEKTALPAPEETAAQNASDTIEGGYPYDSKDIDAISNLADKVIDIQSNPFYTGAERIKFGLELDRIQHPNLPPITYPKVSNEVLNKSFSEVKRLYELSLDQYELGELEGAIDSTKKLVAEYEKILGADSENLLVALDNLGFFYLENEQYLEAETIHQRRINIVKMRHGDGYEKSHHYAIVIESLVNLYVETFEYAKAKPLAEQVLTTFEKTLGPNHDKTGVVLVKLGEIYQATDENKKAEDSLSRAIKIYENMTGKDVAMYEFYVEALEAQSTFYEVDFYSKTQNSDEDFEHIWDKALEAQEEAKKIAIVFLGIDHAYTQNLIKGRSVHAQVP